MGPGVAAMGLHSHRHGQALPLALDAPEEIVKGQSHCGIIPAEVAWVRKMAGAAFQAEWLPRKEPRTPRATPPPLH